MYLFSGLLPLTSGTPKGEIVLVELGDAELVAACNKGDARAWETLVERYKRLVYSIPLRAGLAPEDAADVFQNVFAALFEHLGSLRDSQCVSKWLITTTQRESWSTLKKRQRELVNDDLLANVATDKEDTLIPEKCLSQWVDQSLIREALDRLGGRCKRLLWLLYLDPDEPSYKQVGAQMNMPVDSVSPTRARCLQKLRQILRTMGME